jgi:hypothetical protein
VRGVSDQFLETLRGSHLAVFRARVCSTFQTGLNPSGTEIPILGGDITSSATAEIRSTLSLTTSADWPRRATDLLAPYGNEIFVERGIAFGNGQREWVGLGYYRIDTPEQDEAPDGTITISASDRMAGIVDARFETLRQFPATWARREVVEALVWEIYYVADLIEWDDAAVRDAPVGRAIIAEEDRAGTLKDLLTSLGKVGYFDHRGKFVIKTPPTTTGAAAWTVDAGSQGVLVQMSRGLTREGVYNAVIATGEAGDTTAPARGVAYNLDPTSATYWGGRFGKVPRFYSSPFLTTNAQAVTAAASLLRQQLGLPYQVDLESIANPALEPYDVLKVRYPKTGRSRSLRTETHVVDQVTIPLDPESPVSLRTREQQNELIGSAA